MDLIAAGTKLQAECEPPTWIRRLPERERTFFEGQLAKIPTVTSAAIADNLEQLVPILLSAGKGAEQMRAEVGRAVWRKIHHASEHTNFLRSLIWLRFQAEATWAEIVDLEETHLRSCRNAIDWPTAKLASRLAPPGRFSQTAMLYRDVVNMGGDGAKAWSLAQLKREHARLSVQTAIASADPQDWCAPYEVRQDGFLFSRLTSDRDFVIEGKSQRHCVASMRADARAGTAIILRVTGAERATLRINRDKTLEIAGFANGGVSPRCKRAADVVSTLIFQDAELQS